MLGPEWNVVTTPTQLRSFFRAIAEGKSKQSLLVVGPTSTGKTKIAEKEFRLVRASDNTFPSELNRHALYLDGGATAAQLYMHAYRHADRTLIIDDPSNGFIKSPDGKRLWKQLFATTRKDREITWQTRASFIEKENLENSFLTRSVVIAICNEFGAMGEDIEAVKARAVCVFYNPNLRTRIDYAKEWVLKEKGGRDVIEWLEKQFAQGRIRTLNQRNIYHALEYKHTEDQGVKTIDWKEYLTRVCQTEDENATEEMDARKLVHWVGENVDCGVFTSTIIGQKFWLLRDVKRREAAIQKALTKGMIHTLPKPCRKPGDRTRQPVAIYCLGPDPSSKLSKLSNLFTDSRKMRELRQQEKGSHRSLVTT